ncbi:MAG: hypothetical protein ACK4M7_08220 [Burkholderiales bacterium]
MSNYHFKDLPRNLSMSPHFSFGGLFTGIGSSAVAVAVTAVMLGFFPWLSIPILATLGVGAVLLTTGIIEFGYAGHKKDKIDRTLHTHTISDWAIQKGNEKNANQAIDYITSQVVDKVKILPSVEGKLASDFWRHSTSNLKPRELKEMISKSLVSNFKGQQSLFSRELNDFDINELVTSLTKEIDGFYNVPGIDGQTPNFKDERNRYRLQTAIDNVIKTFHNSKAPLEVPSNPLGATSFAKAEKEREAARAQTGRASVI